MTRMVVPVAERATYELQNLRPVKRSQPLFRVVKNDSQRITRAAKVDPLEALRYE